MLLEFSVTNFLSYKEKTTFSMVASPDDSMLGSIYNAPEVSPHRILKSAAIYGENASGKSNLLESMLFARHMILDFTTDSQSGDPIPRTPFKFSKQCHDQPSEFEWVFVHEAIQYIYSFAVDEHRVRDESLIHYPNGKPAVVFERRWIASKKGSSYEYDIRRPFLSELARLKDKVRDNVLFLSVADQFNSATSMKVMEWFKKTGRPSDSRKGSLASLTNLSQKEKSDLMMFLQVADAGIVDFDVTETVRMETTGFRKFPLVTQENLRGSAQGSPKPYDVFITHLVENNGYDKVTLGLGEESEGTKKMFALAAPWREALKEGRLLIIDEFESHLHPMLSRALIQWFHDPKINAKGAQLVFTTHCSELLDLNLMRRDQIWITEKNSEGATEIYSLYDFKSPPRKDENIRKGYLMGRYGGIPVLGGLAN